MKRLENATYTAAEVKVLTEAALRLGRKEAADQIKQIHKPYPFGKTCPECHTSWPCITATACLELASPARPDATSGRTGPGMDSDLPQDSQAVRSTQAES